MGLIEEAALQAGIPVWLFVLVIVWTLVWKGLALWKSARLNEKAWFIVLLVIQTMGILEILYFFLFSKIKFQPLKQKRTKHTKRRSKNRQNN